MSNTLLKMEDSHAGPVCVLSISGRIDSGNAAELLDRLNRLLLSGEKTILPVVLAGSVNDSQDVVFHRRMTFGRNSIAASHRPSGE